MTVEVVKAGICDTFQDGGRYGYQHLGINPSGCMDRFAMQIANAIVGNDVSEPVLEMFFPSASLLFPEGAVIALSGADFGWTLNGRPVPHNQPIVAAAESIIKSTKTIKGRCGYLAVRGGFQLNRWLDSFSTHLNVGIGGWEGRRLKKGDAIVLQRSRRYEEAKTLPWRANTSSFYRGSPGIRCIRGVEYNWLSKKSQADLARSVFQISTDSNRMAYNLTGPLLTRSIKDELVSAGVTHGTVQVLPSGTLAVLMADHQTTGGYPRVAQVITADLPRLAQRRAKETLRFEFVSLEEAENLWMQVMADMRKLVSGCACKWKENAPHYTD